MKLLLVRHGQTEQNKRKVWQGHTQGALSSEGKLQAKKLARRLSKEKIDVAYCSDLHRAKNTLKPLLDKKYIPTYYVEELRERNLGVLEGLTTDNIMKYTSQKNSGFTTTDFETGETHQEVKKRVLSVYEQLTKDYKGETVLIVTHGGVIAHILMHLFNHPEDAETFRKLVPNNASITSIQVEDGKAEMLKFSDTEHL
ncbi:histidine phosphatase family protein [Candidatus Woesearchaeota archaeon]|nr:histidine phosphatase family protein [Candidatus Woesearchaeota archaeon]